MSQTKQAEPLLRDTRVIIEPGRYLAGPGGLYVARVIASKTSRGTRFIVTDGGMHHHLAASGNLGQVVKRDYPLIAPARMDATAIERVVVAGPLCTPLDTLARAAETALARRRRSCCGDAVGRLRTVCEPDRDS